MDNPKISIIVPVYKAEAYLHRCMESLLAQTFHDYEVLLIDDGSPDRSGELCDNYAARNENVRVIHQPNSGVSAARQKGLDNARGEYVIHADPDDWVEPEMLEELYAKAREEDADMVICDFYANYPRRQIYRCQRPRSLRHEAVLCELFQQLHGSCWNKLVRRVCYNRYNVRFPDNISYCEDLLTNATLLTHDIKVAYLPKAFYHYDQYCNTSSIVRNYTRTRFDEDVRLAHLMATALKGSAAEQIVWDFSCYGILSSAFYGHVFSSSEYRERCKPYRKCCFAYKGKMPLFFYASCLGFYQPAYSLWHFLFVMKQIYKRIFNSLLLPTAGDYIM